jgi:hypothetical protein
VKKLIIAILILSALLTSTGCTHKAKLQCDEWVHGKCKYWETPPPAMF